MWLQNKTLIVGIVLILSACGQKGPLVINNPQSQPTEQPNTVDNGVDPKSGQRSDKPNQIMKRNQLEEQAQ